jgi:xylulokinase
VSEGALGVDVGLSGVRATVVREDGTLVATARRQHLRGRLGSGIAEHDPRDWLEGMAAAGREAVAGAGEVRIRAVGVSAVGPAPVLVDAALEPLTNAPLFGLDRRAESQRRRMTETLGPDEAAGTLDNALPKLRWWQENDPELDGRAAWALDATGFLVASLTGVPVMDTVTAADYELPGIDPPFPLPSPVDPLAVAGELGAGPAADLGLSAGLPVAAGTYDSFVDIAGAGVRRPGDAGIVLGSTMIVCRAAESARPQHGLGVSAYPGEGTLLGGWTLSGGLVLDWFRHSMGGGRSQVELADAASSVDTGGVVALPYLIGERTPLWDPGARGALIGLNLDSGPHEIYRALVESLAAVVRDHTDRIERVLGPCPAWRVTGGGTRNRLWVATTADAVGAPLEVPAHAAEALGPALLALRAIGFDPERSTAATVEPDPTRTRHFESMLPVFRGLPLLTKEVQL